LSNQVYVNGKTSLTGHGASVFLCKIFGIGSKRARYAND
jgi:hypothetical protein